MNTTLKNTQSSDNTTLGNSISTVTTTESNDNKTLTAWLGTKVNLTQLSSYMTTNDNTTLSGAIGVRLNISAHTSENTTITAWLGTKSNLTDTTSMNTTLTGWIGTKSNLTDITSMNNTLTAGLGTKVNLTASASIQCTGTNKLTNVTVLGGLITSSSCSADQTSGGYDDTIINQTIGQKVNITDANSNNNTIYGSFGLKANLTDITSMNNTLTAWLGTKVNLTQLSSYMTTNDNTTLTGWIGTKANQTDLFNNASSLTSLITKQNADNTTLAGNLSALATRIGNQETEQNADNTTRQATDGTKANLTDITSMNTTLYNLQHGDNTTIYNLQHGDNTTLTNLMCTQTKQTADNTTLYNLQHGDNTTLTAVDGGKSNLSTNTVSCDGALQNGTITNGVLSGSCVTLSASSSGGNTSGSGELNHFARFKDIQNITASALTQAGTDIVTDSNMNVTKNFTVDAGTLYADADNNLIGIGTLFPSSKLDINGSNPQNNISMEVNNTLYVNTSGVLVTTYAYGTTNRSWLNQTKFSYCINYTINPQGVSHTDWWVDISINTTSNWTVAPYNNTIRVVNKGCDNDTNAKYAPADFYNLQVNSSQRVQAFSVAFIVNGTVSTAYNYSFTFDVVPKENYTTPAENLSVSTTNVLWSTTNYGNNVKANLQGGLPSTFNYPEHNTSPSLQSADIAFSNQLLAAGIQDGLPTAGWYDAQGRQPRASA